MDGPLGDTKPAAGEPLTPPCSAPAPTDSTDASAAALGDFLLVSATAPEQPEQPEQPREIDEVDETDEHDNTEQPQQPQQREQPEQPKQQPKQQPMQPPMQREQQRASAGSAATSPTSVQLIMPAPPYVDQPGNDTTAIRGHYNNVHVNLMVAGESGLGKSTYIKSFVGRGVHGVQTKATIALADNADTGAGASTADNALSQPTKGLTSWTVTVSLNDLNPSNTTDGMLVCQVHDTKGYGDTPHLDDAIDPVLNALEALLKETISNFSNEAPESFLRDILGQSMSRKPCVDLCFYFISAHRLKDNDLIFMQRLSEYVIIVPVIAKADTMTVSELREFREVVLRTLEERRIPVYDLGLRAAHELRAYADHFPFAVVCAPAQQSGRVYTWGTCEVENREHSDVSLMRELLMSPRLQTVHALSAGKCIQYRRQQLAKDRATATRDAVRPPARANKASSTFPSSLASGAAVAVFVALLAAAAVFMWPLWPVASGPIAAASTVGNLTTQMPWPADVLTPCSFSSSFWVAVQCDSGPCPQDVALASTQVSLTAAGLSPNDYNLTVTAPDGTSQLLVKYTVHVLPSSSLLINVKVGQAHVKGSPFTVDLPHKTS